MNKFTGVSDFSKHQRQQQRRKTIEKDKPVPVTATPVESVFEKYVTS